MTAVRLAADPIEAPGFEEHNQSILDGALLTPEIGDDVNRGAIRIEDTMNVMGSKASNGFSALHRWDLAHSTFQ